MDLILHRFRNLTCLLAAILLQLVLLAYQVKSNQDVRLIRVWSVSAVTPLAKVLETGRSGISRFFHDYFILLDVREENQRLKSELNRIQMDNQFLRAELSTADRANALAIFGAQTPMKTVAAQIIGNTTDLNSNAVYIDRGTLNGIQKGMAVITPDGIVGKVTSVYPTAASVLLIKDPSFAAGVVSQKNHVHGTLKGQGNSTVIVDNVQNEENVEQGERFFTSGDDRIFPKGLPVGEVTVVRPGRVRKDIFLNPSGFQGGLEEVLVVTEGVHAPIPDLPTPNQPVHLQDPPPPEDSLAIPAPTQTGGPATAADNIKDLYKRAADDGKFIYGDRGKGAPDYNAALKSAANPPKIDPLKPDSVKPDPSKPDAAKSVQSKPGAPKPDSLKAVPSPTTDKKPSEGR